MREEVEQALRHGACSDRPVDGASAWRTSNDVVDAQDRGAAVGARRGKPRCEPPERSRRRDRRRPTVDLGDERLAARADQRWAPRASELAEPRKSSSECAAFFM